MEIEVVKGFVNSKAYTRTNKFIGKITCLPTNFTGFIVWGNSNSKVWYKNGKKHRVNGPAVERKNGTKEWYIGGKRHRLDGPAIERKNGSKQWYFDNKRHNIKGPAYDYLGKVKVFYEHGVFKKILKSK